MLKNKMNLVLLLVAAALTGCASPILHLVAPGYDLHASRAPAAEPTSMKQAIEKLNYFHAKYYEAIRQQQSTLQNTSAGLVWLGAGIAALAAGQVHRDVILGTSLIGGTTYAVARTQLDARRVDVWQEGLEALDCAKEASIPLNIGDMRQTELQGARNDLIRARAAVKDARDEVQIELNKIAKASSPQADVADEMIKKADDTIIDADNTVEAANRLLHAAQGLELSVAVDRIHSKVTRAINSLQADISSVKQTLAGIGGFATMFAPGIDASWEQLFKKYSAAGQDKTTGGDETQGSKVFAPLDNSIRKLAEAVQSLALAKSQVNSILGKVDVGASSEALKRCDVTPPPMALTLSPSSLHFLKVGDTKGFNISGGTPPYEVNLLDAPANRSVSIIFSGGFGDSAQVNVTDAAAAGNYTVIVKDSSTAKRKQTLTVSVQPAQRSDDQASSDTNVSSSGGQKKTVAPTTPAASETARAWNSLIAALKRQDFSFTVQDIIIGVQSAELKGNRLHVVVKCNKPPAQPVPVEKLRDLLATADKAAVKQLQQAKALDANRSQIEVRSSTSCLKSS